MHLAKGKLIFVASMKDLELLCCRVVRAGCCGFALSAGHCLLVLVSALLRIRGTLQSPAYEAPCGVSYELPRERVRNEWGVRELSTLERNFHGLSRGDALARARDASDYFEYAFATYPA